jgi:hypothetical protein
MIETFRRFSTVETPVFFTGSLILNCSGQLPYHYDDKIKDRRVDMNAVDISQIPDLGEFKNFEDD